MSTSGLSQILPSGGPLADSMSKNRKEKKGGEETGEHDTGMDYKHKKLTYMVWRKKKKTITIKVHNTAPRKNKTTAPRIPAWSPTVVLTGRYSG